MTPYRDPYADDDDEDFDDDEDLDLDDDDDEDLDDEDLDDDMSTAPIVRSLSELIKTRVLTYILDGHQPVACPSLDTWSQWCEQADRMVATTIHGDVEVSTVFLAVDHSMMGEPVLFETMVFQGGSERDEPTRRYRTWDDAVRGHAEICRQLWPECR